ncbi:unnamed protein product [Meloidogyne enterolobii]|uniref:Uncharacterized protein n=1 Tax=Meloidogyne enterolobii TaxID=390850 RepID=A0ACB0YLL3_MELEN
MSISPLVARSAGFSFPITCWTIKLLVDRISEILLLTKMSLIVSVLFSQLITVEESVHRKYFSSSLIEGERCFCTKLRARVAISVPNNSSRGIVYGEFLALAFGFTLIFEKSSEVSTSFLVRFVVLK